MVKDIEGTEIAPGCTVVFSRNLWHGKDVLCKGIVKTVAAQSCSIEVTTPQPEGIKVYEGWNVLKRAKFTKVFVIKTK